MPQISLVDSLGATHSAALVEDTGPADAADSMPMALSNEDAARLDALIAKLDDLLAQTDTAGGNAKLDALIAATDTLEALLATLIGHVDGVEALQTSTNTKLDTLITATDTVETLQTATNTKLDTLITATGAVETLQTATNTKLDTLITATGAVETLQAATNTKLDSLITATDTVEILQAATNTKLDTLIALTPAPPTTGTQTSIASTITATTALAANANRRGAVFLNEDANAAYVLLAAGTVSATNYSVLLAGNGGVLQLTNSEYTGIVGIVWSADGAGSLRVTEFT